MFVNTWDRLSVERWIFTAVRELGHLLMHPSAYDVSEAEENAEEAREADSFASHFLMPQSLFHKAWGQARGLGLVDRVFKVKRIFRVSWRTVVGRVVAPLERDERERVWQRFAQQYQRHVGRPLPHESLDGLDSQAFNIDEPAGLIHHDFCVSRLHRLVRAAVERHEITMARGAEILGLSLKAMRQLSLGWVE